MSFKEEIEKRLHATSASLTGDDYVNNVWNPNKAFMAGARAALELAAARMDVDEAVAAKWPGEVKVIVAGTLIAQAEKLRTLLSELADKEGRDG